MMFKIGDSVKVKADVRCPDDDSVCIGGWQGRICAVEKDEDIVGTRWDSITLEQLPVDYIQKSEEQGLDWTEMYLSADEIEAASPRDSETTARKVREEMESKFFWLGQGKEGERIFMVIGNAEEGEEMEAWDIYLKQVLVFPFEAKVTEPQDRGPLDYGEQVQVQSIAEADDPYGILVHVVRGKKRLVFPLCDLTPLDQKSPNYTPVRDYCVWFANR